MITYDRTIQVAGIRSLEEARMLLAAGVDILGFPLRLDVHAEDMSERQVADVIRKLGVPERCLVITYAQDAREVAGLCAYCGAGGVQLHGPVSPEETSILRRIAPRLTMVKSLVVGRFSPAVLLQQTMDFAPLVQAFITDTFDPASGASGATGMTHDWSVSRSLVAAGPRPVILAGGLTPDNVTRAIATVRPAGVDVHTGIEDHHGNKDQEKVRAFVEQARKGFGLLND